MNMSRYIKIALFFISLGGVGTVYVVLSADGLSDFNTKPYEVTVEDATGLSTRSKIYLAGVLVGKVQAIQLNGNSARIRLALLKDIEIRRDASITRKASSILGTSILTLNPGTESSPVLPPGGVIHPENGTDINALMGTVSEIGNQVSGILREFQDSQMKLLAVSLETFNSIAGKIDARMEENLGYVSRILSSAAFIAERTDKMLAGNEENINESAEEIRIALMNIRQISDEIAQGRGNVGKTIYDDRLYDSILSTVEETEKAVVKLQTVIDGAGEFINRANGFGIQIDPRVNYGFLRSTVRASASIRLEPASGDRWYRIGVNGAPEGVSSRTVTSTTGGGGGAAVVTDETKTTYDFSIDAELARAFGMVTLRGGILESTAGFGIDLQPWDRLAFSAEIFRFQSGLYPNLKGTVTIYPFFDPDADKPLNWLYIQGGVYDALNNNRRDIFAGGGLRFSDREIKGLAGLATGIAGAR